MEEKHISTVPAAMGRPRLKVRKDTSLRRVKYLGEMEKQSLFRMCRNTSMLETTFPSTVAAAAPAIPQRNTRIKSGSKRILVNVPKRLITIILPEEPSARTAFPKAPLNIRKGEPNATMVR